MPLDKDRMHRLADMLGRETLAGFDYSVGLCLESLDFDYEAPLPPAECGTVACIAGMACLLALRGYDARLRRTFYDSVGRDSVRRQTPDGERWINELDWGSVQLAAVSWLTRGDDISAHPELRDLFTGANRVKPLPPTRAEAIEAVRRVADGKPAWT